MRSRLIGLLVGSLVVGTALVAAAQVRVDGYTRRDGTYVPPHYRSAPDGTPYNNYSAPGNTNPYTGRTAPGGRYYDYRPTPTSPYRR